MCEFKPGFFEYFLTLFYFIYIVSVNFAEILFNTFYFFNEYDSQVQIRLEGLSQIFTKRNKLPLLLFLPSK